MKTLPLLMSVVLLAALLHEAQCTVPADNPDNGVWRKAGNQLHLDCESRYELVGTHRTCHNGQWTGSSPFCRPICTSASRPTLAHGTASCSSQSCSFSCNRGYTLFPHTSHSATCSAPNTWSPSPPTCRMCMEPTLADGTVSCSDPESCSFTCDLGHVMFGSSSARCIGLFNTWSASPPTCFKNCGTPATMPNVDYSSRISAGIQAVPHSWPWMVSFRGEDLDGAVHQCGGSLVGGQWVVTSATCAYRLEWLRTQHQIPIHAVIGAHDLGRDVPEHDIAEFFFHPRWVQEQGTDFNDIALIKLAAPVTYSDEVFPVCLPAHGSLSLATGTQCVATGWGYSLERSAMQDELLQVVLPVSTAADCHPASLPASSFCAGRPGGQELCNGDEGGPLVHQQGGVWTLIGVASKSSTSTQPRCISTEEHGTVFTDVAEFRQWLEDTVRDKP